MSTLGEARVRTSFNPSGNTTVEQIKQKTAELINLCDNLKGNDPERARCFSIAMTHFEDAVMWAVKGATS